MAPHEAQRYKIRTTAERSNARLKEDFGADNIMVKGHSKVSLHLMLGVVVLFADQLIRLSGGRLPPSGWQFLFSCRIHLPHTEVFAWKARDYISQSETLS
jgi:hypothetical protein